MQTITLNERQAEMIRSAMKLMYDDIDYMGALAWERNDEERMEELDKKLADVVNILQQVS